MTTHRIYRVPVSVYEDDPLAAKGNDKRNGFPGYRKEPEHYVITTYEAYDEYEPYLVREEEVE